MFASCAKCAKRSFCKELPPANKMEGSSVSDWSNNSGSESKVRCFFVDSNIPPQYLRIPSTGSWQRLCQQIVWVFWVVFFYQLREGIRLTMLYENEIDWNPRLNWKEKILVSIQVRQKCSWNEKGSSCQLWGAVLVSGNSEFTWVQPNKPCSHLGVSQTHLMFSGHLEPVEPAQWLVVDTSLNSADGFDVTLQKPKIWWVLLGISSGTLVVCWTKNDSTSFS